MQALQDQYHVCEDRLYLLTTHLGLRTNDHSLAIIVYARLQHAARIKTKMLTLLLAFVFKLLQRCLSVLFTLHTQLRNTHLLLLYRVRLPRAAQEELG